MYPPNIYFSSHNDQPWKWLPHLVPFDVIFHCTKKKASPNPEWTTWKIWKNHRFLGSTHCAVTVVNEGLLGFPTKKHDNPGGDSHAGWGADSIDPIFISQLPFHHLSCAMDNLWATRPSEQFLSRLEKVLLFLSKEFGGPKKHVAS